jgi:membrane fusion protein (multidrug efflux system)
MKSRIILAVIIIVAIVGGLAGIKYLQIRTLTKLPQVVPSETIASAVVTEQPWQATLSAIGSVTPDQGVTLATELAGIVKEIAFVSGAKVEKGDLLVRLDTASEAAELRAVEAQVDLASVNVERVRKLRAENTLSQAELDAAEATLKQHQGTADVIRARIAKKTIRAPFAGQLGIRLVNLGEYLDAGKPIVSLQSLSPIHVQFSLPQQELGKLKPGLPVQFETDAFPGRKFAGTLTAMNPELDASTRSVRLQATVANEDRLLRPGMFTTVEVLLPTSRKTLVIPVTAVLSAPFGDSVFVIEPKAADTNGPAGLAAWQRFIRTGPARGDFISVENGLKPGEKVVSAGQFKLRNGMMVRENNELTPKPLEKPRPSDG